MVIDSYMMITLQLVIYIEYIVHLILVGYTLNTIVENQYGI
jgi:hypothetical protein